jgi:hypothetical protein
MFRVDTDALADLGYNPEVPHQLDVLSASAEIPNWLRSLA